MSRYELNYAVISLVRFYHIVNDDSCVKLLALLDTQVARKGGAWLPLGRSTRSCLFEHLIDLFKRESLWTLLALSMVRVVEVV